MEELPVPANSLSDIGISELDVFEILSTLDASKAMGFDGIGPKVLKHCALALFKPSPIFDKSLSALSAFRLVNSPYCSSF